MRKVLIIGNAGSGKSTFARKLAEKTGLPLVHLDKLYWRGDWDHLSREEFDAALQAELDKPEWIIDGNFNRTLTHRLQYCDTVFFFDLPTITCLWGITKRVFTHLGKVRPDMGGNCREYFDKQKTVLYKDVLAFNKRRRKEYYEILSRTENVQVIVFNSRNAADKYLREVVN